MSKRVLIISYYFAPQNTIGAVRPTKLAKFLARMGYEITVLCGTGETKLEDATLARDASELNDVRMIRERNLLRTIGRLRAKRAQAIQPASGVRQARAKRAGKSRLVEALYLALGDCADRSFTRRAFHEARQSSVPYDLVITDYGPIGVLEAGLRIKRAGIAQRWIADFRDKVTVPLKGQQGRLRRLMRGVRDYADAVTTASQGVLDALELPGSVIPNGFDREDLESVAQRRAEPGQPLRFVYCGQLYEGLSDLRPFFRALCDTLTAKERERVRVLYAGEQGALLREQAEGCEALLEDRGLVPRPESLRMQREANALLLASWNTRERHGVLTGKLMEYMMMDRPVIACVSGELADGELRRVIEETGIGICCEQARGEADEHALAAYLRAMYDAYTRGEPPAFQPDPAALARYSHAEMARRFAELIEEGGADE